MSNWNRSCLVAAALFMLAACDSAQNCQITAGTNWAYASITYSQSEPRRCPYSIKVRQSYVPYAAYAYAPTANVGYTGSVQFFNVSNSPVGNASGLWSGSNPSQATLLFLGQWLGGSNPNGPINDYGNISVDVVINNISQNAYALVYLPGKADTAQWQMAINGPTVVPMGTSGSWLKQTGLDTVAYFYNWSIGGTPVAGLTGNRMDTSFAATGTYSLQAIATRADYTTDTSTLSVSVVYQLTISGLSSVHKPCNATYNASVVGGFAPFQYAWTVGGISAGGNSSQLDIYMNWLGAKTVQAQVTDARGNVVTGSKAVTGTTSGVCAQ